MLSAERSVRVDASAQEVLEHVCDLRAYMALDHKIVRVYDSPPVDADGNGHVVFRGSIRGIRSPKQRQSVKLDRWRSVTFESAGPWLADRLVWMRGGFVVEPDDGRSLVTHSYHFRFKGPFGPLIERYARNWLSRDLEEELGRIGGHFEGSSESSAKIARAEDECAEVAEDERGCGTSPPASDASRQPRMTRCRPDARNQSEGSGRVAYRLAYEAALAWAADELDRLEAYRNRSVQLLSATVVALGAGIGLSEVVDSTSDPGLEHWLSLPLAALGFGLSCLGAILLMRPVRGPFVLMEPETLVESYGDRLDAHPTDDSVYRSLALWGHRNSEKLARAVSRRCRWLYASMAGPGLAVGALVLEWVNGQ